MEEDKASKKKEWYVKGGEEDKVFGPIDMDTLVGWARDSRIEASFAVSRDKANWTPAPLVPELEMVWLVETEPCTFYGPFNRAVVDGLVSSGTLAKDVRLYELDTGRHAAERAKITAELEAKTQALSDLEARAAKQAETTKQTMAFMEQKLSELSGAQQSANGAAEAELAAAREEIYAGRERLDKATARADAAEKESSRLAAENGGLQKKLSVAETEIADLRSQLEMVTKFTKAPSPRPQVVQPEIVISDAPPPKAAPRFPGMGSSSGLAALEAAARRELAAAKKHGIGIGGLFAKK